MEYAKEIEDYTPAAWAVQLYQETPFVLIAGITGAGRDTIVKQLTERKGEYYQYVTSTTRPMRSNNGVSEQDGVEYHFLSTDQALEKVRTQQYIEVSVVHECIYGLTVDELQRVHDSGKIGLSDTDPRGVDKFKAISPGIVAIFVVPPSYETWLERAKSRYDTEEEFWATWPTRRESAIRELQYALDKPYYHFVINDRLEDAVEACHAIAHSHDTYSDKDEEARVIVQELLEKIQAHE